MTSRNIIIVAAAVFIGLLAVYIANIYFSGVQSRQAQIAEQRKLVPIVVAAQPMAFGTQVSAQNTRLVAWPANSVPDGAFTKIADATSDRVALRPIVVGEPVLASKVSGVNGRATLSANLPQGLVAFTVPVSATSGVAGFVRPGDVVDVLLTRQVPGDDSSRGDQMTDVLLQSVPVLAIDQTSDENKTDPAVGRTATLQVSTLDAQKLALATKVGALDLALRNVADQTPASTGTVLSRNLTGGPVHLVMRGAAPRSLSAAPVARMRSAATMAAVDPPRRPGPTMTVVRGVQPTEYDVRHGY
jgi:pilus assembly protein CpaB